MLNIFLFHNVLDNGSFSILHINIRSLNKNFENFKAMLSDLNYDFSMICVSETWCSNDSFLSNSNYNLGQYNFIHQERKVNVVEECVCVYINKKYNFYHVTKIINSLCKKKSKNIFRW